MHIGDSEWVLWVPCGGVHLCMKFALFVAEPRFPGCGVSLVCVYMLQSLKFVPWSGCSLARIAVG